MATANKHVVFDIVGESRAINDKLLIPSRPQRCKTSLAERMLVLGTCISFDNFHKALEARLGPKLNPIGIGARCFGYAWAEAAEREYTYLSLSGSYKPVFQVMRSIFYRTLGQVGVSEPRKLCSDEDVDFLLNAYRGLSAREGLAECFSKLRNAGFTVWAFTAGDRQRVSNYLKQGGVEVPPENFVTCDDIGIGKPAPECYKYMLSKLDKEGLEAWFAAAHMWDVAAARRSGFIGAWVAAFEKEPCQDIFGDMDVMAETLPEMADGIIAASAKK
ncbi:hypothetical protein A1O1_07011 [Capronia coronata CBS 617.96]|uniref:2-haloacid dehalogenase n=1 Tax=Capronia coronata CBS 617.96 TaxID=1182541 RepID=W9YMB0_9EURO|nr:uncharacterized protein A1O1_07011 [Capronia coronata CBS 617.96]EXJ83389.1 hypothetical protein A1O1_07011 [Capronia coronata CBS 617.96]